MTDTSERDLVLVVGEVARSTTHYYTPYAHAL